MLEEMMSEIFPNLKEIDIKIQEAQRAQKSWHKQAHTKTYYSKNGKVKEIILKTTRWTQSLNYKGMPIRLLTDISTETGLHYRVEESGRYIQNSKRKKKLQPKMIYPPRKSFKLEGEIKNLSPQKTKRVQNTKYILKEMLKGLK